MSSALATIRAAFKADLEAITVANGYNNTVKAVLEDAKPASVFPSLTLAFVSPIELLPTDDPWSCYNINVPFIIWAEIEAATSTGTTSNLLAQHDLLVQDIMKAVAANYIGNIMGTPSWFIDANKGIKVSTIFADGSNKGSFQVNGSITIRNLDNTFV